MEHVHVVLRGGEVSVELLNTVTVRILQGGARELDVKPILALALAGGRQEHSNRPRDQDASVNIGTHF
jgi:hypothetical protein